MSSFGIFNKTFLLCKNDGEAGLAVPLAITITMTITITITLTLAITITGGFCKILPEIA